MLTPLIKILPQLIILIYFMAHISINIIRHNERFPKGSKYFSILWILTIVSILWWGNFWYLPLTIPQILIIFIYVFALVGTFIDKEKLYNHNGWAALLCYTIEFVVLYDVVGTFIDKEKLYNHNGWAALLGYTIEFVVLYYGGFWTPLFR